MTTIAYRDGIMAADSGSTTESVEGGTRKTLCRKLYRKFVFLRDPATRSHEIQDVIIGVSGDGFAALVFVDAIFSQNPDQVDDAKTRLLSGGADFSALVLTRNGLFEYDKWFRDEQVVQDYYSVGSGSKAAYGAFWMGADAVKAVMAARDVDPYTFGGIAVAELFPVDTDYRSGTIAEDVAQGVIEIAPTIP